MWNFWYISSDNNLYLLGYRATLNCSGHWLLVFCVEILTNFTNVHKTDLKLPVAFEVRSGLWLVTWHSPCHEHLNGEKWVPHLVCHGWAPPKEKPTLSLSWHRGGWVLWFASTQVLSFCLTTFSTFAVLLTGILCNSSAAPLEGLLASRLTWDIALCLIKVSWYLGILS